ncbi:hypothetical protein [Antarctobacter sp.]|uniref:hypothetical protein n=1 Tax=Antarctobacter sp. TaxID=1872577 RepID=UPI002B277952|nr:hypothetical protein [Antarctobacter sp.]
MRTLIPAARSLGARLTDRKPGPLWAGASVGKASRKNGDRDRAQPRVEIPVCEVDPASKDAARLRARGQFLARQDDWEQMAAEIRTADTSRALTAGLQSQAVLMCEGARQDITEAIAEGVDRGDALSVQAAVASLEPLLSEQPGCPIIAYIVAMAHVDAARAWKGTALTGDLPPERDEAYARHMAAAARLNDQFDPFEHETPLWAMVRCAVLEVDPQPHARVADDFEDLIDLDPGNPHHLVQFGCALRPIRFGSWEMLEAQARRTALRTSDVWGVGGYTWVYLGALAEDQGAFRRLDADLFVEGLHDILSRHPSQATVNRMAALIAYRVSGQVDVGGTRQRIADCFGWVVQDHLRELHPLIWAESPARASAPCFDKIDMARLGQTRALATLTEFFAPAPNAGRRLVFAPDGMRPVEGG